MRNSEDVIVIPRGDARSIPMDERRKRRCENRAKEHSHGRFSANTLETHDFPEGVSLGGVCRAGRPAAHRQFLPGRLSSR
jgi:hypothetical protein